MTQYQAFCYIISNTLQEQSFIPILLMRNLSFLKEIICPMSLSLGVAKIKFKPVCQALDATLYRDLRIGLIWSYSLHLEWECITSNLSMNSLYFKNLSASAGTHYLKPQQCKGSRYCSGHLHLAAVCWVP